MMMQRYIKISTIQDENENCGVKMDTHNSSFFSRPIENKVSLRSAVVAWCDIYCTAHV